MARDFLGYDPSREKKAFFSRLANASQLMRFYKASPEVRLDPRKLMRVENQGRLGACFLAGTLVTLEDGRLIPIEEVKFGHRVRTGESRSRQVINTMSRSYTGDIITIRGKGWREIKATADHRFWAIRDGIEQWIEAGDLLDSDKLVVQGAVDSRPTESIDLRDYAGDFVEDGEEIALRGSPTFQPYRMVLDDLACQVIGLFVAEGSTDATEYGTRHRVVWSLHENEVDFVTKIQQFLSRFGLETEAEPKKDLKGVDVRVVAPVLATFLDLVCGRGCTNKKVPTFILQGTDDQKMSFLRGYIDGDGSDKKFESGRIAASGNKVACNQICSTTTSQVLAQQVGMLCVSLGMKPGLGHESRRRARQQSYSNYLYGKDCGTLRNIQIEYHYSFEEKRQASRRSKTVKAGQVRSIRSLSRESVKDVQVYDFEVAEDHSFCANGYVVHNCQGHSLSSVVEWCYMVATRGQSVQLSRAMAYYETQRLDGLLGRDDGSTVENGVKLALGPGLCLEEQWKYRDVYNPARPANFKELLETAKNYVIGSALNVTDYDPGRVFLGSGMGGIHMGIGWGSSMDTPIVETFRPGRGGHSICALCLSSRTDHNGEPYWWIMNSWSEEWGSREVPGWQEWSPTAIRQMLRHEFTVMVALSDMKNIKPRVLDVAEWSKRLVLGGDLNLAT